VVAVKIQLSETIRIIKCFFIRNLTKLQPFFEKTVVLPAVYYWVSEKSLTATLWLYKISSIAALIFGGWFFLKEYKKQNKIQKYKELPGVNYLYIDAVFIIVKRIN